MGDMVGRTGAERYLHDRLADPEYREAHESARAAIDATDLDDATESDEFGAALTAAGHPGACSTGRQGRATMPDDPLIEAIVELDRTND